MNWTQLIQPFQNHSTAMYCQFINPRQLSTSQSSYTAYCDHVLIDNQLCHYTLIHQAQLAPIGICHANQWLIQCQSYTKDSCASNRGTSALWGPTISLNGGRLRHSISLYFKPWNDPPHLSQCWQHKMHWRWIDTSNANPRPIGGQFRK